MAHLPASTGPNVEPSFSRVLTTYRANRCFAKHHNWTRRLFTVTICLVPAFLLIMRNILIHQKPLFHIESEIFFVHFNRDAIYGSVIISIYGV